MRNLTLAAASIFVLSTLALPSIAQAQMVDGQVTKIDEAPRGRSRSKHGAIKETGKWTKE